jgi:hypothetical protein
MSRWLASSSFLDDILLASCSRLETCHIFVQVNGILVVTLSAGRTALRSSGNAAFSEISDHDWISA